MTVQILYYYYYLFAFAWHPVIGTTLLKSDNKQTKDEPRYPKKYSFPIIRHKLGDLNCPFP